MLVVLSSATFVTSSTTATVTPFLIQISHDLATDLGTVGNLIAILSVPWGLVSLAAGTASDRIGRRPVVVLGMIGLAVSRLGFAVSPDYAVLAAWQAFGGLGGGCFFGAAFAAVADGVPPNQRGRALGWIVTGQSLSLVLGVPAFTLLGSYFGWRGASLVHGGLLLAMAGPLWLVLRPTRGQAARRAGSAVAFLKLIDRPIAGLLAAAVSERICFSAFATFLASYVIVSYGVSLQSLAGALAVVALGNLAGNVLGSQLSDRLPARPLLFAGASASSSVLALPLFMSQPGLALTVGLGCGYALANSLGRPGLLAALSEVPGEVRGAIMGLNVAGTSFGWVAGTGLAGALVVQVGFSALGPLTAVTALLGSACAIWAWRTGRGAVRSVGGRPRA